MTHRSDVVLVKGWLLDADDIQQKDRVPEGWEHGLLVVLKPEDAPYSFFLTIVEPDAEHGPQGVGRRAEAGLAALERCARRYRGDQRVSSRSGALSGESEDRCAADAVVREG